MSKLSTLRPQGVSNGNTDSFNGDSLLKFDNITAGTTIRLYLDSTYTWNII